VAVACAASATGLYPTCDDSTNLPARTIMSRPSSCLPSSSWHARCVLQVPAASWTAARPLLCILDGLPLWISSTASCVRWCQGPVQVSTAEFERAACWVRRKAVLVAAHHVHALPGAGRHDGGGARVVGQVGHVDVLTRHRPGCLTRLACQHVTCCRFAREHRRGGLQGNPFIGSQVLQR
jgi:hypothetical protein